MRDLTSLQCLEIAGCPELQRRCEKQTGQDLHKIAYITSAIAIDVVYATNETGQFHLKFLKHLAQMSKAS
ncbi:putative disease resistance protein rga4 [Quercus suber]|uniref:Disease resistance protein rga4 n=1 Tax=Quercus suber TaxID=58331 RepID=A0AAW0KJT6_QUESU